MAGGVVFIDGEFVPPEEARMSIFDYGFTWSDCVYDVTSVWHGWFFKLDEHLERFERSCEGFRLTLPYDRDEVKAILAECVDRAGLEDAYVKVEVTRGLTPNQSRDLRLAQNRFTAYAIPFVWIWGEDKCRDGASLHLCRRFERVSSKAIDQRFKNYNRADLVQGRLDAYDAGCDDAVLVSADGSLSEGFGWNILLVKDGAVATPDWNVLEGRTRDAVEEICRDEGIPYELRRIEPSELETADEVFAATTAGGVMPVIAVDSRPIGDGTPGPVTRLLQDQYWSKREAGWHGTRTADLPAAAKR
jgi:branched-subunit amino acid aminotransferase/4-amino-4-deoxychorismate lyase